MMTKQGGFIFGRPRIFLRRKKKSVNFSFNTLYQPFFTLSKWNMGEIYGLKLYFVNVHISQKKILKSLHEPVIKVLFITEVAIS